MQPEKRQTNQTNQAALHQRNNNLNSQGQIAYNVEAHPSNYDMPNTSQTNAYLVCLSDIFVIPKQFNTIGKHFKLYVDKTILIVYF